MFSIMTSASELIDAKIGASEARTDSKFEQLLRHIDLGRAEISARLDSMDARMAHIEMQQTELRTNVDALKTRIWNTGWGVASFVVGSMIAIVAMIFTVGPYAFDKGQEDARTIHADVVAEVTAELARR